MTSSSSSPDEPEVPPPDPGTPETDPADEPGLAMDGSGPQELLADEE